MMKTLSRLLSCGAAFFGLINLPRVGPEASLPLMLPRMLAGVLAGVLGPVHAPSE